MGKKPGLPNFNVSLERDNMNVGNVLREAGYTTGFVGKYHLTSKLDFPEFYKGKNGWIDIPKDASQALKPRLSSNTMNAGCVVTFKRWAFPGRRMSTRKTFITLFITQPRVDDSSSPRIH